MKIDKKSGMQYELLPWKFYGVKETLLDKLRRWKRDN